MKISKLAVWSFVLVLVAWFFIIINEIAYNVKDVNSIDAIEIILAIAFWLVGLISIVTFILGVIAFRKIKTKKQKGKGLAIATIILSLPILIYFLWTLYAFYSLVTEPRI